MPDPTTKCEKGSLGPVVVFKDQNYPSSCFGKDTCDLEEVCLEDSFIQGDYLVTKEFKLLYPNATPKNLFAPPFDNSPNIPSLKFSYNFTFYTLQKFIGYLDSIRVYSSPVADILNKKPFEVSIVTFANAAFIPGDYSLVFGYELPNCGLPADAGIILHEMTHLLIYTVNQSLGFDPFDLEGPAIHETIADVIPAIYHNNPYVGAGALKCFKPDATISPENGLRRVDDRQGVLLPDEECHGRTEIYSPFFWYFFKNLETLVASKLPPERKGEATRIAQVLAIPIILNAPKYMPTTPAKRDVVKAMLISTFELGGKTKVFQELDITFNDLNQIIIERGKSRQLITRDDIKWLQETPTMVLNPKKEEIPRDFKLGKASNDLVVFDQYKDGVRVIGGEIKFVKTYGGYIKIDSTAKIPEKPPQPKISSADASVAVKGLSKEALKKLLYKYRGNMSEFDLGSTLKLAEKELPSKNLAPTLVLVKGSKNPQYLIQTKHLTYFVDAVTKEVSVARYLY